MLDQRRAAGNTDIERPIKAIERSAGDMRDIVEALLWLARSETNPPRKETTDLADQIGSLLEDHRYLLANKSVFVQSDNVAVVQIKIEQPYFRIVLSNLIRNAFEHTELGTIEITCSRQRFSIRNPLPVKDRANNSGRSQLSPGFGIGMTVIGAISDRLGWILSVTVQSGEVVITLDFQPGHMTNVNTL